MRPGANPRAAPPAPDPDAALARAERFGHRFVAPPAPMAPAAVGPIQRVFDVAKFKAALAKGDHVDALRHVDGASSNELKVLISDPEIGHADLGALYEKTWNPTSKLHLWRAFHAKSAEEPAAAKNLPAKPGTLEAGILEDVLSSSADLASKHAQSGAWDYTKRQEIKQLEADRRRAREVELEHGVSIRPSQPQGLGQASSVGGFRAFSQPELDQLSGILARLPARHIAGNPNLHFIRREQQGSKSSLGALYKSGESGLDIYDQPKDAVYRATDETDSLGGHGEENPVTLLEEVVTHEIGHAVERQHPAAFAKLKAAAGWEEYRTADEAKAALAGDGMDAEEARREVDRLHAERDDSFHQQSPVVHDGYEYRAHPDNRQTFVRRQVNRMPGDRETPESGGRSHADYAKTSPKEHFAELYAQMVHVPMRTYADYVQGPKGRLAAAQEAYLKSQFDYGELFEKHGKGSAEEQDALRRMEGHGRAVAARQEEHDALGKQWDVMREEVFGVDQGMVDRMDAHLRAKAQERGVDEAEASKRLKLHARRAATPRQLGRLGMTILNGLPERK